MRNELKIVAAEKTDHAAIVVLLQEADLPPDGIELHMENFLIIRHPEAVAGPEFIIGSVGLEVYGESALLRSLAVHSDFQGMGLGSRLVIRIIKVAKERGINRLFLLTDTAEEFFKKRGFIIVKRDKVPDDMKQSIEFTKLCTSSPSMVREI